MNTTDKINSKEYLEKHIKIQPQKIIKDSNNKKKSKCRCFFISICCTITIILAVIIFIFLFIGFPTFTGKERSKKRKISAEDFEKAKYNTFLKLNNVQYPTSRQNYYYKDEYLSSFYNFTYIFFNKLNFKDFSTISLYNVLINIYMGISDEELAKTLDDILGLNETERILFYSQIIQNNYFKDSNSEIKISNGGFYNSDNVKEKKSFVDKLTETYTECYKLSYRKDFNYIIDWINKSVKEKDFTNKDIFGNLENTSLLLVSTLYYQQNWKYKFIDSKIYKWPFYINKNKIKEVKFMNHKYTVNYYFDYEDYYSFHDFYSNEYTINYLVPKSKDNNILELIKDKNFLYEKQEVEGPIVINLSVPKFKREINLDIIPILKELGLEKLFDRNDSTFNNPFIIEENKNYYVDKVFQKNRFDLNEDGTTIKSITFASSNIFVKSAGEKEINIELDRPFIYIIKDRNRLPIFIGYIDDPDN